MRWTMPLKVGATSLRLTFTNDRNIGGSGVIRLDRLTLTDGHGQAVVSHEFEDLEPPVERYGGGACGHDAGDHFVLWTGGPHCALWVDVEVLEEGVYNVEVVASADPVEQHAEDRFAKIAVAKNVYRVGDTWYRDMRLPGFAGALAPSSDNSVQWLARQIVADKRFAGATVEFWWPAIMGSEVAEPPEDEADADFEALLLAANAQGAEVSRLADGFRRGFHGRAAYNLKDLLVEIVLSKWFRADAVEDANPVRLTALRNAGARRMLTPEELARKTAALTDFSWGRHVRVGCHPTCERRPNALTEEYRLLYGGIDSDGVTERARDITSVMAGVANRHAAIVSCPVVMRELYLVPESERNLFSGIDKSTTPRTAHGADAIRNKLVKLHDKLLGVQVTPHSPDVEAAFRLFVDVSELKRQPWEYDFRHSDCYWNWLEGPFLLRGNSGGRGRGGRRAGVGKKVVLRFRPTPGRRLHERR